MALIVPRHVLNLVWDVGTLQWVVMTQPSGGGGGGAATIADGADVAEGATTDVAVLGDSAGTVSAKLRGINKEIADAFNDTTSGPANWSLGSGGPTTISTPGGGTVVLLIHRNACTGSIGVSEQFTPGGTFFSATGYIAPAAALGNPVQNYQSFTGTFGVSSGTDFVAIINTHGEAIKLTNNVLSGSLDISGRFKKVDLNTKPVIVQGAVNGFGADVTTDNQVRMSLLGLSDIQWQFNTPTTDGIANSSSRATPIFLNIPLVWNSGSNVFDRLPGDATNGAFVQIKPKVSLSDALSNPQVPQIGSHLLGWDPNNNVWRRVQVAQGTGSVNTAVPDGANVVEGLTTDAAVTTDVNGTLSAKMRGLVKMFTNVWSGGAGSGWLRTSDRNLPVAASLSTNIGAVTSTQIGSLLYGYDPASGNWYAVSADPTSGGLKVAGADVVGSNFTVRLPGDVGPVGAFSLNGHPSLGIELNIFGSTSFIGTVVPQVSFDGGSNFVNTAFIDASVGAVVPSYSYDGTNSSTRKTLTIVLPGGATHAQLMCSASAGGPSLSCVFVGATQPGPAVVAGASATDPVLSAGPALLSTDLSGHLRARAAGVTNGGRPSSIDGATAPLSLTPDGRLRVAVSPEEELDFFTASGSMDDFLDPYGGVPNPFFN